MLALIGTTAVIAIGGQPDPAEVRAASPLLGGPWRFHLGDDPRWAGADIDDSAWETMDLSAPASSIDGDVGLPNYVRGWMAHGHPGYQGYAWYRRTVAVPAGNRAWDIVGPTLVEDGYELYWNGKLLGGSGQIGASPRVVGTRPLIFALPADAAGTQDVLAIRTFMQPGNDASAESGGIHVAPTLAPRPESQALYRAEWWRSIAGYIVEAVEPLAMFALIGLALAIRRRSSHQAFIAFIGIALALSGVKRLDNAIVSWTDLMSLPTYAWLSKVLWMPLSLAAWALAWNRWNARASRAIDGAIALLTLVGIAGALMKLPLMTHIFRLGVLALFAVIAERMIRSGPMRNLAIATLATILVSQYAGELGSLGVPTIWFPFGIGVTLTQYVYALAIPLLAVLIVRTLQPRNG
ncbi:glycoside hydrolase family 2 [Dyella sp. LX-66]|nr:glycoside hydrolase family 2 [Dyella sp. LX-1]MBT2139778.1 glycoside hydrolase family 2 [Dyella sp. LX-66]